MANQEKHISSATNQAKHSSSPDDNIEFLLKEDSFCLLLESGGKIVLNQSTNYKHKKSGINLTKH